MSDPKNRERLERVYDAAEASLDEMTSDELREQVRALGDDPPEVIRTVRAYVAGIVKGHRQTTLRAAQLGLRAAVEAHQARRSRIPADFTAQRALIAEVAHLYPQQVTMHHRDLEALPDEELEEILKQFDALGLLPDNRE